MKARPLIISAILGSLLGMLPAKALGDEVALTGFPISATRQKLPHWCWAASLESVFKYYKVKRSQEQIVLATYGRLGDFPAFHPTQMVPLLNSTSFRERGGVDVTLGTFGYGVPTNELILAELRGRHPVVAWYTNPGRRSGHAVVIFGADYVRRAGGEVVQSVRVFDPWPGMGVRTMPAAEFRQTIRYYFVVRLVSSSS